MSTEKAGRDAPDLPCEDITADQVVAANIRHWRRAAGMTLAELGRRLGKTEANMSAIERSASSSRERRRFDAQDLVALSFALGVPVAALLLPPEEDGHGKRYLLQTPGGERDMSDLLGRAVLFPPDDLSELAEAWRARLNRSARKYLGADYAEHTARLLAGEGDPPSLRSEIAAMFRAEAERTRDAAHADLDRSAFLERVAEQLEPFPGAGTEDGR